MTSVIPFQPVFHLYNRSNDRSTLYTKDRYYDYFMGKVRRNFSEVAHLLGYCMMPNHFHLLISPKQEITRELRLDDKPMKAMPNEFISEAVRRTLMGFTKGYNTELRLTGSRFQQKTKCKYHWKHLMFGLNYLHENPPKSKLVDHPSEWGYSSHNEYAGLVERDACFCDLELGLALLDYPMF